MQQATTASILVAVAYHFDPSKVHYLADMLQSVSKFTVRQMKIVILTNTFDDKDIAAMNRLCLDAIPRTGQLKFAVKAAFSALGTWKHLEWCHKPIIVNEFVSDISDYTHFSYLEADVRLSF
jgi:hypothetical protein